ncbi:hypothetical protein ACFT25_16190 [Streptomyces hydrogenans]|uniref:hypothetical protein n=1 Tax=Streptomyces hydrogenans TaxID=1873719 RepID=UPI00362E5D9C
MDLLTWQERMMLFREGPEGPELLWLWLIERGLLFCLHSWDAVFRMANRRCREVLVPVGGGMDPHRVYAHYATPHVARHSFALFILIMLDHVMDRRYGLRTPNEMIFRVRSRSPSGGRRRDICSWSRCWPGLPRRWMVRCRRWMTCSRRWLGRRAVFRTSRGR